MSTSDKAEGPTSSKQLVRRVSCTVHVCGWPRDESLRSLPWYATHHTQRTPLLGRSATKHTCL